VKLRSIILLVGGEGRRLHPITRATPKCLVNVNGRPFLFWLLDFLKTQEIEQVVLCTGHRQEEVVAAIGDSYNNIGIKYSSDGETLVGTGAAVRNALELLDGEPTFVQYGDSYLPISYSQVWDRFIADRADTTMTVFKNDGRYDNSNAHYSNGKILRYRKGIGHGVFSYIDYGLSIMSSKSFARFSGASAFDLGDVFSFLADEGELHGFEVNKRFYEIGSFAGLASFKKFVDDLGVVSEKL